MYSWIKKSVFDSYDSNETFDERFSNNSTRLQHDSHVCSTSQLNVTTDEQKNEEQSIAFQQKENHPILIEDNKQNKKQQSAAIYKFIAIENLKIEKIENFYFQTAKKPNSLQARFSSSLPSADGNNNCPSSCESSIEHLSNFDKKFFVQQLKEEQEKRKIADEKIEKLERLVQQVLSNNKQSGMVNNGLSEKNLLSNSNVCCKPSILKRSKNSKISKKVTFAI